MLVLVAGSDLEYCARIGDSLRRDSHQVVMAADFAACRQFRGYDSVDAVIMSASDSEQVPTDLIQEVHTRHGIPFVVLVDEPQPAVTSPYVEAGAECITRPANPDDLTVWVNASSHR